MYISQSGDMIIQDPEIQRDYSEGDFLRTEDDVLPEGLQNITRIKRGRGTRCLAMDSNGRLTTNLNCPWVRLSCRGDLGCPSNHIYQTCTRTSTSPSTSDEYIMLCSTTNNNNCVVHLEATAIRCEQCCISDDCGPNMRKCSAPSNGMAVGMYNSKVNVDF